ERLDSAVAADREDIDALSEVKERLKWAIHGARSLGATEDELREAEAVRKSIHNRIEDLKGSIRVFCRVRPPSGREAHEQRAARQVDPLTVELSQEGSDVRGSPQVTRHLFHFDAVFSPGTQAQVFQDCRELVQSALDGFNVTIFAYGQTGAGKTFTMAGTPSNAGVAPRTIEDRRFTGSWTQIGACTSTPSRPPCWSYIATRSTTCWPGRRSLPCPPPSVRAAGAAPLAPPRARGRAPGRRRGRRR
ncbi:unnamed protein product, partial [Prorocentrum cordatum]